MRSVRHKISSSQSVWLVRRQYPPWMGHHRAFDRAAGEANRGGALAGLVGVEFDVVVLGDAAIARLESPNPLPDLVDAFAGARARQSIGELGQRGLEALHDAAVLVGTLLGEAIKARFILGHDLVQMHPLSRCGLDALRGLGVELADAVTADHQVPIAIVAQPLHALLGGDSTVHDHERLARGTQRSEPVGHGVVFSYVAGEHLGAAHEAARIEHQRQGEKRAIGALVPGGPARGLGLTPRRAFEEGVGQVIERDRGVQVKQPHRAVEQVAFDGLTMGYERVRGARQLHRPHRLEIDPEQLAKRASFPEPAPRRAVRARARHAGDDRADHRRTKRRGHGKLLEPGAKRELVHRPQPHLLHAERARTVEFERSDIHALDVGSCAGGAGACEQLGDDALRMRLQPRGIVLQCELTGEDLVDPPAKRWPVRLRDLEVSSQVEQGALAHLGTDTLGTNELKGEVPLARSGASDEHRAYGSGGRGPVQDI